MHASLACLKWRCRAQKEFRGKFGHLMDSQVCLAVLTKWRSTSMQLRHVLRKVASLMLLCSMQALYVYIRTDLNPADAPSRWPVGKE